MSFELYDKKKISFKEFNQDFQICKQINEFVPRTRCYCHRDSWAQLAILFGSYATHICVCLSVLSCVNLGPAQNAFL